MCPYNNFYMVMFKVPYYHFLVKYSKIMKFKKKYFRVGVETMTLLYKLEISSNLFNPI